jgi:hypothetical protein
MAYDSALVLNADAAHGGAGPVAISQEFRRDERFAVLMGGAALGILAAFGGALALGRIGLWPIAVGAPIFLLAVYFSIATFRDAIERKAFGCATAAALVAISLLAWPMSALFFSMATLQFWIAPAAALASMVLLASCWTVSQGAVYRLSGEAMFLCAIVGYLGITQVM